MNTNTTASNNFALISKTLGITLEVFSTREAAYAYLAKQPGHRNVIIAPTYLPVTQP